MIKADVSNKKGGYESVVFPMSEKDMRLLANYMDDQDLDVSNVYSEYYAINEAMEGDQSIEEFNYTIEKLVAVLKTEEDWEKLDAIVWLLGFTRDSERLVDTLKLMDQYVLLRGVTDEESLGKKIAEMNGGVPKWLEPFVDMSDFGYKFYLTVVGEFHDFGFIYKKEASNG